MTLGVGKNMVKSIRHWSVATGVLADTRGGGDATDFGARLFSDEGWDPYMEDPATVWLLHWQLCRRGACHHMVLAVQPFPSSSSHLRPL